MDIFSLGEEKFELCVQPQCTSSFCASIWVIVLQTERKNMGHKSVRQWNEEETKQGEK